VRGFSSAIMNNAEKCTLTLTTDCGPRTGAEKTEGERALNAFLCCMADSIFLSLIVNHDQQIKSISRLSWSKLTN